MRERRLTCIACPRGCLLTIRFDGAEVLSVTGNACPKGLDYGRQEAVAPMRMLTTTVATDDPEHPRLPVRLSREVPLADQRVYLQALRRIRVVRTCRPGDILAVNLLNRGVDVIATGVFDHDR